MIPSSEPENDAQVFTMLFSDFTRRSRDGSLPSAPSSVTLVGKSNTDTETIVVFCETREIGSLPTVLLLPNIGHMVSLSQILEDARRPAGVQVLPLDGVSASDEKVLLRFNGGGTLLVVTSQKVEPCALAEWIVAASALPGADCPSLDGGSSSERAIQESAVGGIQKSPQTATPPFPSVQESKIATAPSPAKGDENGGAIIEEQRALKLPRFPTLQVTLNGAAFPLNAPSPVSFENDLFKGSAVLLLRPIDPPKDDPYWNDLIWAKRKRRVSSYCLSLFACGLLVRATIVCCQYAAS